MYPPRLHTKKLWKWATLRAAIERKQKMRQWKGKDISGSGREHQHQSIGGMINDLFAVTRTTLYRMTVLLCARAQLCLTKKAAVRLNWDVDANGGCPFYLPFRSNGTTVQWQLENQHSNKRSKLERIIGLRVKLAKRLSAKLQSSFNWCS